MSLTRYITIIIALLFVLLSCFIFLPKSKEADAISGDWYSYRASSAPSGISTPEQLAYLLTYYTGYGSYYLVNDIDMGAHYLNTRVSKFIASLDGRGFTIKNIYVDSLNYYSGAYYAGVFNWLDGTVVNVRFLNVQVSFNSSVNTTTFIGGICGKNTYNLSNCYINGTVSVTVRKSNSESDISYVGGVAGYNSSTTFRDLMLQNVRAYLYSSDINLTGYVGGLVGYSTASIVGIRYSSGYVYSNAPYCLLGGLVAYTTSGFQGIILNNVETVGSPSAAVSVSNFYYSRTDHASKRFWGGYEYLWSLRAETRSTYNSKASLVAYSYSSCSSIYLTSVSGRQKQGSEYVYRDKSTTGDPRYPVNGIESYLYSSSVHTSFMPVSKANYDWLNERMGTTSSSTSSSSGTTTSISFSGAYTSSYPTSLPSYFSSAFWISQPYIDGGHPVLKAFYWEGQV